MPSKEPLIEIFKKAAKRHTEAGASELSGIVMCDGCEAVYAADDLNTADHLDLTGTHWTYEFCDACMRAMKEEEKTLIDGISGSALVDNLDVKFNV